MLKGFKDFLLKGDLISVAVGLVMALATFALVESLVTNLITPIIAAIVGEPSFGDLSFTINDSLFRYGAFINALIVFVSAPRLLLRRRPVQGLPGEARRSAKTRPCPECTTTISVAAKRCPSCTATVLPESV